MPTIIQERGFQVMIYLNDHAPPHVHVWKAGEEASIYLDPVAVRKSKMNPKDTKRAVEIVTANRDTLLESWNEIYGNDNDAINSE